MQHRERAHWDQRNRFGGVFSMKLFMWSDDNDIDIPQPLEIRQRELNFNSQFVVLNITLKMRETDLIQIILTITFSSSITISNSMNLGNPVLLLFLSYTWLI